MHERTDWYAGIDLYFKWDGAYSYYSKNTEEWVMQEGPGMSLSESIEKGLTALEENLEFNESEKDQLSSMVKKIPDEVKETLNIKYKDWKKTGDDPELIFSGSIEKYTKSTAYKEMMKYCKKTGKRILPLLFQYYCNEDPKIELTIYDLTEEEYKSIMDEIEKERSENQFTPEGAYILSAPNAIPMKYMKKLLASSDNWKLQKGYKEAEKEYTFGNTIPAEYRLKPAYPNPFNSTTIIRYALPDDARVTVRILDLMGKEIAVLEKNKYRLAGWYTVPWNGKDKFGTDVSSGIYFCQWIAGNIIRTKKMLLAK